MKNRTILNFVFILMSGWIFTDCTFVQSNKPGNTTTDHAVEKTSDQPSPATETNETTAETEARKAMEAYKALLQNNFVFYSTNNKKNYTLNAFNYDNGDELDKPLEVLRFGFVQLEGDEVETLVLELSSGYDGAFEVLRYQEGIVYGFNFSFRALLELQYDGTSYGSNGASDGSFQRLSIEKDICKEVMLAYSESNSAGNISYYIADKKVTWGAYEEFASGMRNKSVVWHDFTDDNVAMILSPTIETLLALLRNSTKIIPFSHIVEHGGNVYSSSFRCMPEWKPVAGVTHETGGFAVVSDALIYYCHPGYTAPSPIELLRSDLQGGNVTKITEALDNFGNIYAVGDRVIYSTINDDFVRTGVFWYNVKTSQSTRLLNEMPYDVDFTLVTFDDMYVYYQLSASGELWRVRWDGTGAQPFEEVKFPVGLYQVDEDYYYCISLNEEASETEISRFSMKDGFRTAIYSVKSKGLFTIRDGFPYFANETGIYKISLKYFDYALTQATFEPEISSCQFEGWQIIGEDLYFTVTCHQQENAYLVKLYKMPIKGGKVEYQHVEWVRYVS